MSHEAAGMGAPVASSATRSDELAGLLARAVRQRSDTPQALAAATLYGGPARLSRQPAATLPAAPPPAAAAAPPPTTIAHAEFEQVRLAISNMKAAPTKPKAKGKAAKKDPTDPAVQQAVLALAAVLRSSLPSRSLLDGYLARTNVPDADKTRTIGRLVAEVARMEFLLGRIYHGGGGKWEPKGNNRGAFPDVYVKAAGGGDTDPWCTKFAGYAQLRLGFHAADKSSITSMFYSGYRTRLWATEGKTLVSKGTAQTTDATKTAASGAGGSAVIDSADWKQLTKDLLKAKKKHAADDKDGAAARAAVTSAFLAAHTTPQSGDVVVKVRGTATTNTFTKGMSHTMLVDRFDGRYMSTVEGNAGDRVGARRMDLHDPAHTGQLIILTRLGTQFFGTAGTAPAEPAPAGAVDPASEASLVGEMTAVNGLLVAIASAEGWIASSDPDATVAEWQSGAGAAGAGTIKES